MNVNVSHCSSANSSSPTSPCTLVPSSVGGSIFSLVSSFSSMASLDNISPPPPSAFDLGNNASLQSSECEATHDDGMESGGQQQQQQQQLATSARFWAKTYDANYGFVFSGHVSLVLEAGQSEPVIRVAYEAMEQLKFAETIAAYRSRWDYSKRVVDYPVGAVLAFKLAAKRCEIKLLLEAPARPATIMFDKPECMDGLWRTLGTMFIDVSVDLVTPHLSIEEVLARKEAYFFVKREFPLYRASHLRDPLLVTNLILADLEQDYRKNIATLNDDNLELDCEMDDEAFSKLAHEVLKRCWSTLDGQDKSGSNNNNNNNQLSFTSSSLSSLSAFSPLKSPSTGGKNQQRE